MKPLKTRSKPILKNVDVNWYGKIHLKILRKKTNKVHKKKNPFKYFNYVLVGHKNIDR
jgi:hypothetical protein